MPGRHNYLMAFSCGGLRRRTPRQDIVSEALTPTERLCGLSLIRKEADSTSPANGPNLASLGALQLRASMGKKRCLPHHTWRIHAETG